MTASLAFTGLLIILIDAILSIDNAAVLGSMAHQRPNSPVPPLGWIDSFIPFWLKRNQRDAALRYGIVGAFLGRGLMLAFVSLLITIPAISVIAGLYLILLAYNFFADTQSWIKFDPIGAITGWLFGKRPTGIGFWQSVLMIELADLAFSMDNVVAVISLSRVLWVVIAAVCVSIFFMRFAAQIFERLIDKEPALTEKMRKAP